MRTFPRLMVLMILALTIYGGEGSAVLLMQAGATDIDRFFSQLVLGAYNSGQFFLEIPLKDGFFGVASEQSSAWLWTVRPEDIDPRNSFRSMFYRRLFRFNQPELVATRDRFWGEPVSPLQIDWEYLRAASEYREGESLEVATTAGLLRTRLTRYEVRCSESAQQCVVFGIGQAPPAPDIETGSQVIAGRSLNTCAKPCIIRQSENANLEQQFLARAEKIAGLGPIRKEGRHVLLGYFTNRKALQAVVHLESASGGRWHTVLLASDSDIFTLGKDSYLQIIPTGLIDLNGDGIDELTVRLQGSEGFSLGIVYWRKTTSGKQFGLVRTFLNGM